MAISVAKGTKLTIGGKAVAHLTKIGSPSVKWDTTESTALDTEGDFKEFLTTFAEGGEVSVTGNFDISDEGQKAMIEAMAAGTDNLESTIVFPKKIGAEWAFKASVNSFATSAETAGIVTFDATLKVSGKPELKASTETRADRGDNQ
mgnify:FL=1